MVTLVMYALPVDDERSIRHTLTQLEAMLRNGEPLAPEQLDYLDWAQSHLNESDLTL